MKRHQTRKQTSAGHWKIYLRYPMISAQSIQSSQCLPSFPSVSL